MSDHTNIEWADATWYITVGCSKVNTGCAHCYAIRDAHRLASNPNPKISAKYSGLTVATDHGPDWSGTVRFREQDLFLPFQWRRSRRIFVMTDLFHESITDQQIDKAFVIMGLADWHLFMVLTKRYKRLYEYLSRPDLSTHWLDAIDEILSGNSLPENLQIPLQMKFDNILDHTNHSFFPNIMPGFSFSNQSEFADNFHYLADSPAAYRFISLEPLLSPITLNSLSCHSERSEESQFNPPQLNKPNLDLVIAGGESGPHARPSHPDWFRMILDDCIHFDIPFFFKQWGEWVYEMEIDTSKINLLDAHFNSEIHHWDREFDSPASLRVGKQKAGRLLDKKEWSQFPSIPLPPPDEIILHFFKIKNHKPKSVILSAAKNPNSMKGKS